jgi:hypothetical protein
MRPAGTSGFTVSKVHDVKKGPRFRETTGNSTLPIRPSQFEEARPHREADSSGPEEAMREEHGRIRPAETHNLRVKRIPATVARLNQGGVSGKAGTVWCAASWRGKRRGNEHIQGSSPPPTHRGGRMRSDSAHVRAQRIVGGRLCPPTRPHLHHLQRLAAAPDQGPSFAHHQPATSGV